MASPARYNRFVGLRNALDPLRLITEEGVGLTKADNIYIHDERKMAFAEGFIQRVAGTFDDLLISRDEERAYFVRGTELHRLNADYSSDVLYSSLPSGVEWEYCEVNEQIYLLSLSGGFVLSTDNEVREWGLPIPAPVSVYAQSGDLPAGQYQVTTTFVTPDGRESGAGPSTHIVAADAFGMSIEDIQQRAGCKTRIYISSVDGGTLYRAFETTRTGVVFNGPIDALTDPLRLQFAGPPPVGEKVAYYNGRIYISEWYPENNVSMLSRSHSLGFEHFDAGDAFLIPGRITVLGGASDALVIGTDSAIFLFTEEGLREVADYGAPPGRTSCDDGGKMYFWTERGVCVAPPFENLTEDEVSVAPGTAGNAVLLETGGVKKYVVLLDDEGSARNQY